MDNMKRYDQIPHTADLAAKVRGRTLEELFENAAFAMFDMSADLSEITPELVLEINAGGADRDDLLVSWLNELLFRSFSEGAVFNRFKVAFPDENSVSSTVKGACIRGDARRIKKEIKAATYHDLEIKKTGSGYEVTIVFDV